MIFLPFLSQQLVSFNRKATCPWRPRIQRDLFIVKPTRFKLISIAFFLKVDYCIYLNAITSNIHPTYVKYIIFHSKKGFFYFSAKFELFHVNITFFAVVKLKCRLAKTKWPSRYYSMSDFGFLVLSTTFLEILKSWLSLLI